MAALSRRLVIGFVLGGILAATVLWPATSLTAAGQVATAQTPQQPPARGQSTPVGSTALILGQVVDGVSGQPLADAVVSIGFRGGGAGGRGSAPSADASQPVITGVDGRFVFRDLPPGAYPVRASLTGYVDGFVGQGRPGGPERSVEVADGERIGDAKIRLWRHGSITGTVLDEAGEPAVLLEVQAFRRITSDGRPQLVPASADRARTDDRGRYRFAGLTPGDYVVVIPVIQSTMPVGVFDELLPAMLGEMGGGRPPDWIVDLMTSGADGFFLSGPPARVGDVMWSSSIAGDMASQGGGRGLGYRTIYYPAATSVADASVVTVSAGQARSGIDMRLTRVPIVRVSGTLIGPTGPMSNLAVRLQSLSSGSSSGLEDLGSNGAITLADGTFTFFGVPQGQYVLRAIKAPRNEMLMRIMSSEFGGPPDPSPSAVTSTIFAEQSLSVGNADITGLTLTMREGPKVTGRVEFELASPRTGGPPAAGAAGASSPGTGVTIAPIGGSGGFSALASMPMAIDTDGRFKSPGYAPGRYKVDYMIGNNPVGGGRGSGAASLKSIIANGRDITNAALELQDVDVDIVIKITDRLGSISGTARGANGIGAPTATVVLIPADYRALVATGLMPNRSRTIAARRTGAYTITGLVPGDYLVAAMDDADVSDNQDAAFFDVVARLATRVTVADAQKVTQDLTLVKVKR